MLCTVHNVFYTTYCVHVVVHCAQYAVNATEQCPSVSSVQLNLEFFGDEQLHVGEDHLRPHDQGCLHVLGGHL